MKYKNLLSLNDIKIGDSCYVKEFIDFDEKFKKRMYDLGFVFNSSITPLYQSLLGKTVAYLVKGSVVALRENDANRIIVSFRR